MVMQLNRHEWLDRVLAAVAAAALLVGCAGLHIPVEPTITLSPTTGGPGTRVLVTGSDFPATTTLAVRLGPPDVGATPQTYGEATSDTAGRFQLAFDMPARWPDGSPVTEEEIVVVVLNEDGSVKAVAPFLFQPAVVATPSPSHSPGPLQAPPCSRRIWFCWLSILINRSSPLPLSTFSRSPDRGERHHSTSSSRTSPILTA
jgi:hypothetical protein